MEKNIKTVVVPTSADVDLKVKNAVEAILVLIRAKHLS